MQIIREVESGSVAEELGIESGDYIVKIGGYKFNDFLDLIFYEEMGEFLLEIQSKSGEIIEYEVELYDGERLGIVVDEDFEIRSCCNNCIFCFVNQLPCVKGLRNALRVKDDDWRMSVIYGNFVTLTNLKKGELDRIIRQRFSPLYVSVHTVNPILRKKMLGTKKDADILPILKRLKESGTIIHAQIVLCPDVNDGEELTKSIEELSKTCESLAIVPVGLTDNANPSLRCVDAHLAGRVIDEVQGFGERFLKERGTRFCFAADEFYVLAQREVPPLEYYEDLAQIENGVGLIARLRAEVKEELDAVQADLKGKQLSVVTGMAARQVIEGVCADIASKLNAKISVWAIENNFFGRSVTVAGLVTGSDIISQLKGKDLGQGLLMPRNMLKEFHTLFLDNISVADVQSELGVNVQVVDNDGACLVRAVMGEIGG